MWRKLANLIFRIRFAHWPDDPKLICDGCAGRGSGLIRQQNEPSSQETTTPRGDSRGVVGEVGVGEDSWRSGAPAACSDQTGQAEQGQRTWGRDADATKTERDADRVPRT